MLMMVLQPAGTAVACLLHTAVRSAQLVQVSQSPACHVNREPMMIAARTKADFAVVHSPSRHPWLKQYN